MSARRSKSIIVTASSSSQPYANGTNTRAMNRPPRVVQHYAPDSRRMSLSAHTYSVFKTTVNGLGQREGHESGEVIPAAGNWHGNILLALVREGHRRTAYTAFK